VFSDKPALRLSLIGDTFGKEPPPLQIFCDSRILQIVCPPHVPSATFFSENLILLYFHDTRELCTQMHTYRGVVLRLVL